MANFIYHFKDAKMDEMLLGNKGAQLAAMTKKGLPVPPGFTVTTAACKAYYDRGEHLPKGLMEEVREAVSVIERDTGRGFGTPERPLLLSVRSGSYVSMPGMMDTILNLGLNERLTEALAAEMGDERAAWDCYRRLVQMYGEVVFGLRKARLEAVLEDAMGRAGVAEDSDLTAEQLRRLTADYKKLIEAEAGRPMPDDPAAQLGSAVEAVFASWDNARAVSYRRMNGLKQDAYTGVNVQAMVFGNMGSDSGTGVGFTRNPATGDKGLYGEYLSNAQGEDVVAGVRTPTPISQLRETAPELYRSLEDIGEVLEGYYKDVQDFEFTVEKGTLYLLQTRTAKRTARAAVKTAVDMEAEGLIDKRGAIVRIDPAQIEALMHKQLDHSEKQKRTPLAEGRPASPGGAVGAVCFSSKSAREMKQRVPSVLLARKSTSPEDVEGMDVAAGVLTSQGGMTSHAAAVARAMGKPCVVGVKGADISPEERCIVIGDKRIEAGEMLSIDGGSGEVFEGEIPLVEPTADKDLEKILGWADAHRGLGVRANADTPDEVRNAASFGAEGIGLCRTEHMFFGEKRITAMWRMIFTPNIEEKKAHLGKLLPYQRQDFEEIFEVMDGKPVTVRLLDPPLHEFIPSDEEARARMRDALDLDVETMKQRLAALEETNPMLGYRGCRLLIAHPEIVEMQVRAILEAALEAKNKGIEVQPEIMVPMVAHQGEYRAVAEAIRRTAAQVFEEADDRIDFRLGTMIETPRAALIARRLAADAEFFSFGTNDLTQLTFGFSRDDAARFAPRYLERGILASDPFRTLDTEGVGRLIAGCAEESRQEKASISLGICGEHGGDPSSIRFCHGQGLDYVSCSPFRTPIARLVAAQAAVAQAGRSASLQGR